MLISVSGCDPVPVEVALVTNATMDKWVDKINADTVKLTTLTHLTGLQIVACFDTYDFEHHANWLPFLNRIRKWNELAFVCRKKILGEGLMLVKGWQIQPENC